MKMKNIQSLFVFMTFYTLSVLAQDTDLSKTSGVQIPPSPSTAVFRQFAGHSPSIATGTINLDIDLFDIDVKGFTLPFKMQYHSKGISVYDTPYPLGYGWILHPGLRISRTIRGRADDRFPKGITNQAEINQLAPREYLKTLQSFVKEYDKTSMKDSEYDVYTIHLPQENHQFIIYNDKPLSFNSTLIIEKKDEEFVVTDKDGVIYRFGGDDAFIEREAKDRTSTSLAWVINTIELPDRNSKITFDWVRGNHTGTPLSVYTVKDKSVAFFGSEGNIPNLTDIDGFKIETNRPHDINRIQSDSPLQLIDLNPSIGVLFLSKVNFPEGFIEFKYKNKSTILDHNLILAEVNLRNNQKKLIRGVQIIRNNLNSELQIGEIKISNVGSYLFEYYPYKRRTDFYNSGWDYWGFNNDTLRTPKFGSNFPNVNILYEGGNSHLFTPGYLQSAWSKEVNEEGMIQGMLHKIIYPGKGMSIFEYEAHRLAETFRTTPLYVDPRNHWSINKGGGLRVSKIITKQHALDKSEGIVKTYRYGVNEDGKAKCGVAPTIDTFIDAHDVISFKPAEERSTGGLGGNRIQPSSTYLSRQISLRTISNYQKYNIGTNPNIFYEEVAEYINDGTKNIYKYNGLPNNSKGYTEIGGVITPTQGAIQYVYSNYPYLESIETFKQSNTKIKEVLYTYEKHTPIPLGVEGLQVIRKMIVDDQINDMGVDLNPARVNINGSIELNTDYILRLDELYDYHSYRIYPEYQTIKDVDNIEYYDKQQKIKETTSYKYHEDIVTSIERKQNGVAFLNEEFYYPFNALNTQDVEQNKLLKIMKDRNFLTMPIAVRTKRGKAFEEKTYLYKDWSKDVIGKKIDKMLSFNIYPEKVLTQIGNGKKELRLEYKKYDVFGNPLSIVQDELFCTRYFWGYKGQHVFAEFKGHNKYMSENDFFDVFRADYYHDEPFVYDGDFIMKNSMDLIPTLDGIQSTFFFQLPLIGVSTILYPDMTYSSYEYNYHRMLTRISHNLKGVQKEFEYQGLGLPLPNFSLGNIEIVGDKMSVGTYISFNISEIKEMWTELYQYKFEYSWYIKNKKTGYQQRYDTSIGRLDVFRDEFATGEYEISLVVKDKETDESRTTFSDFYVIIVKKPTIKEISRQRQQRDDECIVKYLIDNPNEFSMKGEVSTNLNGQIPPGEYGTASLWINSLDTDKPSGSAGGEMGKPQKNNIEIHPGLSEMTVHVRGTSVKSPAYVHYDYTMVFEGTTYVFSDYCFNR